MGAWTIERCHGVDLVQRTPPIVERQSLVRTLKAREVGGRFLKGDFDCLPMASVARCSVSHRQPAHFRY